MLAGPLKTTVSNGPVEPSHALYNGDQIGSAVVVVEVVVVVSQLMSLHDPTSV